MPFGWEWWEGYEERRAYKHLLDGNPNTETLRAVLLKIIEPEGFKKTVYFVAMSGFLADSYAIFSPNVVSPALAYIYWSTDITGTKGLVINVITLAGSCIGMVLFGWLADVFGRKRLYGVELVIGIIATLGLTQVSAGYNQQSMSPFAWIVWWRFILGIGIGAEYPLSALIAAEWSATSTRADLKYSGTMLAAVFLMQPIGQFLAYIVGYAALVGITRDRLPNWTSADWDEPANRDIGAATIDSVWRCVIGVGAFPALIAIALRFTIPETPRYLLDVREDLPAAAQATRRVHPDKANTPSRQNSDKITKGGSEPYLTSNDKEAGVVQSSSIDMENKELTQRQSVRSAEIRDQSGRGRSEDIVNGSFEIHQAPSGTQGTTSDETRVKSNGHAPDPGSKISGKDLATQRRRKNEFWYDWHTTFGKGQGFRRILAGISICWFIMDMSFYGLGLDTPRTLAKIFGAQPSDATKNVFDWNSGFASQDENIYDALLGDATRALYTIPISGIFGSVFFLLLVNYIPRATVLRWMFVLLAILFAIAGSSLTAVYETTNHSLTVAFYALALCILNFGPNTILFMLPAELFPTRYRGTCYGIAAASGKAGAILIQIISHFAKATDSSSGKWPLAIMLMCFSPLMLIGAFFAWVWIPDVQEARDSESKEMEKKGAKNYRKRLEMPPRSLEDITNEPTKGQLFGIQEHIRALFDEDSAQGTIDIEANNRPSAHGVASKN